MPSRDILLLDSGGQTMQALSSRLRRLRFRPVRVKSAEAAREALRDERYAIRAALLSGDIAASNLCEALAGLEECSPEGELRFVATGPPPPEERRAELRQAGVRFALFEPFDGHALRFLLNRVAADHEPIFTERSAMRAPADWAIQVRSGCREKPAQVYSISRRGAYLATERPSLREALVHIALPLPDAQIATAARVVMTNVPGNLVRQNLPLGMGVRFTATSPEVEAAVEQYVEARLRELAP